MPSSTLLPTPLPAPYRQQSVDGAYAHVQCFPDRRALKRIDRTAVQRHPPLQQQRTETIERPPGAVEHASQQTLANRHLTHPVLRTTAQDVAHAQTRRLRHHRVIGNHPRARHHAINIGGRHDEQMVTGKTRHFSFDVLPARNLNLALAAHRHAQPHRFHHQTGYAGEASAT